MAIIRYFKNQYLNKTYSLIIKVEKSLIYRFNILLLLNECKNKIHNNVQIFMQNYNIETRTEKYQIYHPSQKVLDKPLSCTY